MPTLPIAGNGICQAELLSYSSTTQTHPISPGSSLAQFTVYSNLRCQHNPVGYPGFHRDLTTNAVVRTVCALFISTRERAGMKNQALDRIGSLPHFYQTSAARNSTRSHGLMELCQVYMFGATLELGYFRNMYMRNKSEQKLEMIGLREVSYRSVT